MDKAIELLEKQIEDMRQAQKWMVDKWGEKMLMDVRIMDMQSLLGKLLTIQKEKKDD